MHRFESQPAYILHARPYSESSVLLELLTQEYGRIAAIAKGVKRISKRGRSNGGVLQPFVPLIIACSGKNELLTLKSFDSEAAYPHLMGRRLVSALYLNELLMRLLHRWDAHPDLFLTYRDTLRELESPENEQIVLRLFEKKLLTAIGYGLQLTLDIDSGKSVDAEQYYIFNPEQGPSFIDPATHLHVDKHPSSQHTQKLVYKGASLLALEAGNLRDPTVLQDAKRLMREALARHLGSRPLETRKLFV